jgi:hypothetical protein
MPEIPVERLIETMAAQFGGEETVAHQLLAGALDALDWPTKPAYTPEEATAIGLVIADASAELLARQADPLAREGGTQLQAWVALMADQAARLKAGVG